MGKAPFDPEWVQRIYGQSVKGARSFAPDTIVPIT